VVHNSGGEFIDAFSDIANRYAKTRPTYPSAFFEALAGLAPTTSCAWDCGTGNGQAAEGLSKVFDYVEATDASAEQIAHAPPFARVRYRVAPAEASGLPDRSVDLVSVAQALHWFDLSAFYAEVRRVARPRGLLAVYGYSWFYISPEIDALAGRWLFQPVESYWSTNNQLLWDGYRTIDFPFQELAAPRLAVLLSWTLQQLFDYYVTWSAPRRKIAAEGDQFVAAARRAFETVWENPATPRQVVMPMVARLGRLP
jgi:SAM-dependent methyltransferase